MKKPDSVVYTTASIKLTIITMVDIRIMNGAINAFDRINMIIHIVNMI